MMSASTAIGHETGSATSEEYDDLRQIRIDAAAREGPSYRSAATYSKAFSVKWSSYTPCSMASRLRSGALEMDETCAPSSSPRRGIHDICMSKS